MWCGGLCPFAGLSEAWVTFPRLTQKSFPSSPLYPLEEPPSSLFTFHLLHCQRAHGPHPHIELKWEWLPAPWLCGIHPGPFQLSPDLNQWHPTPPVRKGSRNYMRLKSQGLYSV